MRCSGRGPEELRFLVPDDGDVLRCDRSYRFQWGLILTREITAQQVD